MIEISVINNWASTINSILAFRRSLLQAVDIESMPLHQLPYVTDANIREIVPVLRNSKPKDFKEVISVTLKHRETTLKGLNKEQLVNR